MQRDPTEYTPSDEDSRRDRNNFLHHAPHSDQADRYADVRLTMLTTATQIRKVCPPSRELSLALTKLEEAMFWANASIARNEPEPK